jgi:hypothetical protein
VIRVPGAVIRIEPLETGRQTCDGCANYATHVITRYGTSGGTIARVACSSCTKNIAKKFAQSLACRTN